MLQTSSYSVALCPSITGHLSFTFAGLFLLLAIVYGVMLSELAMESETFLLARYPRLKDRVILLAAALLESFGYRQILTYERFKATFQVWMHEGEWGEMPRSGFGVGTPEHRVTHRILEAA